MTNDLTDVTAWIVPALLTSITLLLGLIVWFLKREIGNNDKAHAGLRSEIQTTRRELRSDVQVVESDVTKLLEGNVAWVQILLNRRDDRGT